jgi:hypothetical protein
MFAMRIDENVGVYGDHPPRSAYVDARTASQPMARASSLKPAPLHVALRSVNGLRCLRSGARCVKRAAKALRFLSDCHREERCDAATPWRMVMLSFATALLLQRVASDYTHCVLLRVGGGSK